MEKLNAKIFGSFEAVKLNGKNAVKMDLSLHFKIHPVVHVIHTTTYREQPSDRVQPLTSRPDPRPTFHGEEHVVETILDHRKKGRGNRFLTRMKRSTPA